VLFGGFVVLEGYWCELGASPEREWWLGGPKHPKMSSDNLFPSFTLPLEIRKALRIVTSILKQTSLLEQVMGHVLVIRSHSRRHLSTNAQLADISPLDIM
jgi:hypothetical protein